MASPLRSTTPTIPWSHVESFKVLQVGFNAFVKYQFGHVSSIVKALRTFQAVANEP